jgi:hypothetical protein
MSSVAKSYSRVLAAATLLAVASPAFAQPAEEPAPAAQVAPEAQPPEPKDKVVCRREIPLGSKLPVTRCERKSVIDEDRRRGRDFLEDVQIKSRGPFLTDPQPRR